MHKISKPQPSSDFEYLSGNESKHYFFLGNSFFFASVFVDWTHTAIGSVNCHITRTFRAWTLLTWLAFKQYNSWTDPFWKRSTSLYVRWTYKVWFLPKLSSQNTAFCHEERAMSRFSFPVSMVYAWNAWDYDPPFGDQNACILGLGLSYGSPSKKKRSRNLNPGLTAWVTSDWIKMEAPAGTEKARRRAFQKVYTDIGVAL